MNVAVYGAGLFGTRVAKRIEDAKSEYKMTVFIDNYKRAWHQGPIPEYPIVDMLLFQQEWKNQIDIVIVAVADWEKEQEMVDSLLQIGFENIYLIDNNVLTAGIPVITQNGNLCSYIKKYTEEKPVLKYIEFHVTDYCNLKCKNCSHQSDTIKELTFSDLDKFEEAIHSLSKKFRNIQRFRLMGGEPLLSDQLDDYIHILHKYFPMCDIKIVSNGLLYEKMTEKLMQAMRDCRVELQISAYPPSMEKAEEIISFCRKNNLWLTMSGPIDRFHTNMSIVGMKGVRMNRSAWRNCIGKECRFLRGTKLYSCTGLWVRNTFEYENVDRAIVDLTDDDLNGWEVLSIIGRPLPYCGDCKIINPEWEVWEKSEVSH